MIRKLTGGRQMPKRTSKTKVKKKDNFKGTGKGLNPIDYLVKPSSTAKKAATSSNYKKSVPNKASVDSKGIVSLSKVAPKDKKLSIKETVASIKEMQERSKARQKSEGGKVKEVKDKPKKARTGFAKKDSGALGRGNRKPKGGYITKATGTPRI